MSRDGLDAIDRKILRELQKNARITNSALAQRVGLSPTPCWKRVRALEKSGIIQGYVTVLDPAKLGYGEAVVVQVTLEHHSAEDLAAFGRALEAMPEVTEAIMVTGDYDYHVRVAVSGTRHFEKFLREKLYRIPGIQNTKSCFVLRQLKGLHGAPVVDR